MKPRQWSFAVVSSLLAALVLSPAWAQAVPQTAASAFATGAVVHADALHASASRLVDAEVAFSSAATVAKGNTSVLGSALLNEVGRAIHSALQGKTSYARGSSVELGLNVADGADNTLILTGKAEDVAPVSVPSVKTVGPLAVAPLVYAELLHGSAVANGGDCVLGGNASRGRGFAADVELIDTGTAQADGRLGKPLIATEMPGPERAVAWSNSLTRYVAQTDKAGAKLGDLAGLMAEVRETIAPVRLFVGTPIEINIEVLGQWVLQTVATGKNGGAWVHYGPENVSPETRVIRISVGGMEIVSLTTQQLLMDDGLQIVVPGVAEIAIGEAPRAIGGDYGTATTASADGTSASAAVDVVRVKLLPSMGVADVRVGHMEASAHVPAGGIQCPLPVSKVASKPLVKVGETFDTKMTVTNPYDCDLSNTTLTDTIATTGSAAFDNSDADGGTLTGDSNAGEGTWSLGTILAGKAASRDPVFTATAGPGTIDDTTVASAICSTLAADGHTKVGVAVSGQGSSTTASGGPALDNSKSVRVSAGATVKGVKRVRDLPATGVPDAAMILAGFGMLGLAYVGRKMLVGVR